MNAFIIFLGLFISNALAQEVQINVPADGYYKDADVVVEVVRGIPTVTFSSTDAQDIFRISKNAKLPEYLKIIQDMRDNLKFIITTDGSQRHAIVKVISSVLQSGLTSYVLELSYDTWALCEFYADPANTYYAYVNTEKNEVVVTSDKDNADYIKKNLSYGWLLKDVVTEYTQKIEGASDGVVAITENGATLTFKFTNLVEVS